jgi:hypothetical protein
MIDLLIGILATWRLTSLLHNEDGPFDMFALARDAAGVRYDELSRPVSDNPVGKALTCFYCTSVWAGLIIGRGSIVRALAYSAGAILVKELTGRPG